MTITCTTDRWVSTAPYLRLTITNNEQPKVTTLDWKLEYISEYPADTFANKNCYVKIGDTEVCNQGYDINGKTGTHVVKTGSLDISKTTSSKTLNVTLKCIFNITWSGVYKGTASGSTSITIPAITSYTITYDANGGSSSYTPAPQTKWHDETVIISSGPRRLGHHFTGWGTSPTSQVVYEVGDEYMLNKSVTLYAIWTPYTYTIKYDANGGSGAPSNGTKTYNQDYTIPSTIPTRADHDFLGWGDSQFSTTAQYQPGDKITNNTNDTLYAIWLSAYTAPKIYSVTAYRGDAGGMANDEGKYGVVKFSWVTSLYIQSVILEWESSDGESDSMTITGYSGNDGYSGTLNIPIGKGQLSPDKNYTVRIAVTDTKSTSYAFTTISGTKFTIDYLNGGNGIAFGKPAEEDGVCDIAFRTRLLGGLLPVVLEPEMDLNNVHVPGTYTGENISAYNYLNCPVTSGTFTLLVESGGEQGQVRQTFISCDDLYPKRFVRFHYLSKWYDWMWAGTEEKVLYENSSGEAGKVTFDGDVSRYRYIEIYFKDNAGYVGGYTKIYNLVSGNNICLSMQEAAASSVMFRQTKYAVSISSGVTSLTPDVTNASYIQYVNGNTAFNKSFGTNYLRIVRVIGRA